MGIFDSIENAAENKVKQKIGAATGSSGTGLGSGLVGKNKAPPAATVGTGLPLQVSVEYSDKWLLIANPRVTITTDSNGLTSLNVVGIATTKAKI